MDTRTNLTTAINGLIGLRKEQREFALKQTERLFFSYLTENNHTFFKRDLIKSFFDDEVKSYSKNIIIKSIIDGLVVKGKITKTEVLSQSKRFLRNRPLFANDFNSYNVLMAKNGYTHMKFFNMEYDKVKKIPVKRLIKKQKIGDIIDFDFDECEIVETITRKSQRGVIANTQNSLSLIQQKNKSIAYKVN